MANWYNIPEIEFHGSRDRMSDFQITYNGVRDSVGVEVEESFWNEFLDTYPHLKESTGLTIIHVWFEEYMESHGDDVKALIEELRAASNGVEL